MEASQRAITEQREPISYPIFKTYLQSYMISLPELER